MQIAPQGDPNEEEQCRSFGGTTGKNPETAEADKKAGIGELSRAFAEVHTALVEQREACRKFQSEVDRLDSELARLNASLGVYQETLAKIDTRSLRRASLRLADMMDTWADHTPNSATTEGSQPA